MKNAKKNDGMDVVKENSALYQRGQLQVLEMGDNVADGVLVVDETGIILGANILRCPWVC